MQNQSVLLATFTRLRAAVLLAFVAITAQIYAQSPITVKIQANKPGAKINPAMWGIFFEDINFGADGGLYAELVKNRGFEFPDPMMGWSKLSPSKARGTLIIREENPFNAANPHYVRVESEGKDLFGIANEGFRGIGVRKGDAYNITAQIRNVSGTPGLRIELYSGNGSLLDSVPLRNFSSDWKKYSAVLHPNDTDAKAKLYVLVDGRGVVDLDFISLFPEGTWKNRPGGLRADMVKMLADLKPGFMRFPGGCIVEGSELDKRYQWKNTIGPVAERKLLINRWNYEFLHRPTPDYFQSFGLGFFEFFQLCEDIGAQPLPILNCGMACQFNSGELCPLDELGPYIQDALDLIEFANGPVTSTWGAKRAAMGHPESFNMKMLGIGNEQWAEQYIDRYVAFSKVLKEKHPEIALISASGPSPADERFQFLWPKLLDLHADIVDQHCYANPIWFLANSHRYDNYDRNGPKVFMGEYAAQSVAIVSTKNRNNLDCALAEAAYMTGLERNADVVRMASYAPLFGNADAWQWTPNLIWADSLNVYATPNYYVQQLFSRNRGDEVLPVKLTGVDLPATPSGRIGLGTYRTSAEFKDVLVTHGTETLLASDFSQSTNGWTGGEGWDVKDGAYQQSNSNATSSVFAGENAWSDYTLSSKARKLGGSEGFLIMVRYNGPEDYILWNLGANRNSANVILWHFAQQDHVIAQNPGSIESGRWYDVKIELKGGSVSCYLDGKLVQRGDVPAPNVQSLYVSATKDDSAGELILKVVNPGERVEETEIDVAGASVASDYARATVLTSSSLADENSFADSRGVAPQESPIQISGPRFTHTFPARSMTMLRLKIR